MTRTKDWHDNAQPWMVDKLKAELPPAEIEACQQDAQWWETFTLFAKLEFCPENIAFLDEVDGFKKSNDMDKAVQIYENYVKAGSPDQVNLPSTLVKPLTAILEDADDPASLEMFDEAYKEILKITRSGTYKNFIDVCAIARPLLLDEDVPPPPPPDDEPPPPPPPEEEEVAKVISGPTQGVFTRDMIDMAVVDNFNQAALKDLKEGLSTNFWQLDDVVIIDAGMGVDQPYVKWLREQPGVTRGSTVTMTAKAGAFSSGTVTVSGASDQAKFKTAVARVSKKKVVFG